MDPNIQRMASIVPLEDFHGVMAMAHRAEKCEVGIEERGRKGKTLELSRSRDYRLSTSRSDLCRGLTSYLYKKT